jgi:hypothetical protein
MYALLATPESRRYGYVMSRHATEDEAIVALEKACRYVLRSNPNAITRQMYCVSQLPTPAGEDGKVNDRIAIDLSR